MALATPALRPSVIIDDVTRRPKPDPVRTSDGMNFGPTQEDLVVAALNRRIACSDRHLLRSRRTAPRPAYVPGQEYKPHLGRASGVATSAAWTASVYINDGYEGGETIFDRIGVSAKGSAGDCLVFRNVDGGGLGDPRAATTERR